MRAALSSAGIGAAGKLAWEVQGVCQAPPPGNIRGTLHPLSRLCLCSQWPSDTASYVSVLPERHSLESGYLGLHPG